MQRFAALAGALYGATGVLLGAFGAHALRSELSPRLLETWQTAVSYQLLHALALLCVFLVAGRINSSPEMSRHPDGLRHAAGPLRVAGVAFALGVLLFSGSLYILCLTGSALLGPVTPLGGISLIVGWVALALALWRATDGR